jgi:hypothetical protein
MLTRGRWAASDLRPAIIGPLGRIISGDPRDALTLAMPTTGLTDIDNWISGR